MISAPDSAQDIGEFPVAQDGRIGKVSRLSDSARQGKASRLAARRRGGKSAGVALVHLEALMHRANVHFTNGYRVSGDIDADMLQHSFSVLAGALPKFSYRLHCSGRSSSGWKRDDSRRPRFRVVDCDDPDQAFSSLCRDSATARDGRPRPAMALTLLRDRRRRECTVVQTCDHVYFDGRSANVLFNHLAGHYNASRRGDAAAQAAVSAAVAALRTVAADDILRMLPLDEQRHRGNLESLCAYGVADPGGHALPVASLADHLPAFREARQAPVVCHLPLDGLLARCRAHGRRVSRNSAICAALAKGFYEYDRDVRAMRGERTVSFYMLFDLLTPALRMRFNGNYVASVPVSVDGALSLPELAWLIDERARAIKSGLIGVSLFRVIEELARSGQLRMADNALSFTVSNVSNHDLVAGASSFDGCRLLRHYNGLNMAPRDPFGAALANRPMFLVNNTVAGEWCLSLAPSLDPRRDYTALLDRIREIAAG